jgi:hypothetical protein
MHPATAFFIGSGFTLLFLLTWYLAQRDADREAGVNRGMLSRRDVLQQRGNPVCPACGCVCDKDAGVKLGNKDEE